MTPETQTAAASSPPPRPPGVRVTSEVEPYQPGFAEKLYLPLFKGMWVTMKHFLKNLFGGSKYIINYPEERRDYSQRFRGHHILTTRPDGSVRCVACFLCSTACPAECIHIEAGEHPDENIEKYPLVYEIDMLRCVFCGYCVDACPEEAIIMSNNYDLAYFTREQSKAGKSDLMKPFTFDASRLGYRPTYPEEDAKRAQMRREAFDLVSEAKAARERDAAQQTAAS
jgi:NADH-quinone oxidoreductase subunit I